MTDLDHPAMRARVAVPASSANLGPGFDCMALALDLQNEVTVEQTGSDGIELGCDVDSPAELRDTASNLVVRAYAACCAELGVPAGGVRIDCVNRVPLRRGLGSSAAAALSGVLAAAAIHRPAWDDVAILDRVTAIEGHADNAAAALLGGLAIAAPGAAPRMIRVPDELRCVLLVPDVELPTSEARRLVPAWYSRVDAVFNAGRCALLVRAVLESDWEALGEAMDDRFHQHQRSALLPWLPEAIAAARAAGAHGACLSGAGPSVLALTVQGADEVADALAAVAARHGLGGGVMVRRVRNYGSRVDAGMSAP